MGRVVNDNLISFHHTIVGGVVFQILSFIYQNNEIGPIYQKNLSSGAIVWSRAI